VYNWGQ